ncbi:bifunctional 2-polyprenyl-6-hydroxyphenol methylase/3-demethylubiquinol 3-O-methyltransferase UbiG [Flavobacterium sp.]|uniref:class I SAM-dependent methyltransferase n=1 Tax=Flavobacterium sp. TaxID=239 RepID=UPI00262D8F6A|nr:class I SAM-dependent methyltransferase [Flavobacterium sp.]
MAEIISQNSISKYLKTKSGNLGIIDKLKVIYRPLICPFDKLLNYVENDDSVFDIGCGSGQFCALVAKFTASENIMGIEISDTLIQNAKNLNQEFISSKSVQFEVFNGFEIPNTIKNYSKIFLIDVLHHVPKKNQFDFLKEIYSKMSNGSVLILKDIDDESLLVYFNKIHDFIFSGEIGFELKSTVAKKLTKEIGFNIIDGFSKRMFVYPHYFLILRK